MLRGNMNVIFDVAVDKNFMIYPLGKQTPHHEQVWSLFPFILRFAPKCRYVISLTFRPLYPEEQVTCTQENDGALGRLG
jgi:hypothetical protein